MESEKRESVRYLNKKDALRQFRERPGSDGSRGPARIEAWRRFVEELFSNGRISTKQHQTWYLPS